MVTLKRLILVLFTFVALLAVALIRDTYDRDMSMRDLELTHIISCVCGGLLLLGMVRMRNPFDDEYSDRILRMVLLVEGGALLFAFASVLVIGTATNTFSEMEHGFRFCLLGMLLAGLYGICGGAATFLIAWLVEWTSAAKEETEKELKRTEPEAPAQPAQETYDFHPAL